MMPRPLIQLPEGSWVDPAQVVLIEVRRARKPYSDRLVVVLESGRNVTTSCDNLESAWIMREATANAINAARTETAERPRSHAEAAADGLTGKTYAELYQDAESWRHGEPTRRHIP